MRKLLTASFLLSLIFTWSLVFPRTTLSGYFLETVRASVAAISPAEKIMTELKERVNKTKEKLKQKIPLDQKVTAVTELRSFITHELNRQEHLKNRSDPNEDVLALDLIGWDQDLGVFLDSPKVNFNNEHCEGYRAQLIHSYSRLGSESPQLPSHTQEVLGFLELLCKSK